MERLSYLLPEFARYSWTGRLARDTWESRIQRIATAWHRIEMVSVVKGLRSCASFKLPPAELPKLTEELTAKGLITRKLPQQEPDEPERFLSADEGDVDIIMGTPASTGLFLKAWDKRAHNEMGELLGYPGCCREFYHKMREEGKWCDTIWHAAVGNVPVDSGESTGAGMLNEAQNPVETVHHIKAHPLANCLLHSIDIKSTPHFPCSYGCSQTIAAGKAFIQTAKEEGYADEMRWLEEILSWPVEWSALHGIAEIKTPVFKLITRTDATARKYTLRIESNRIPVEGAQGNTFPYLRLPVDAPQRNSKTPPGHSIVNH